MTPTVRRATQSDVAELADMRRRWTLEEPPAGTTARRDFEEAFTETVGAGIASGRWIVWLAEESEEIVSHVFVGLVEKIPRPTRENRWIGYVTNVYTRPGARGRGVGGLVLEHAKLWCEENDVELLFVWPSDESLSFYERAGFSSGRDPLVWERT